MAIFFTMPKLGINMTEGRVVNWFFEEGSEILKGIPLIEVETDKATVEVEAPASGILAKIIQDTDDAVPCNTVLAVILTTGEELPAVIPLFIDERAASPDEKASESTDRIEPETHNDMSVDAKKRVQISPSARKLAEELGVEINSIVPKGSIINREDVKEAFELLNAHKTKTSGALTKKPYSGIRKRIGDSMTVSSNVTAQVPLFLEAEAEGLIKVRNKYAASLGKISYDVLFAKIVAEALVEIPYMNSQIIGNEIAEFSEINIGIAVDNEKGLLVPVLKNTNGRSIEDLNTEFTELINLIKIGKIAPDDLEGGTFTITNLGAYEVEWFSPIINYPQCAILGIGKIKQRAVFSNGTVTARHMIGLTLVFDHRIVDGAPAARFLQRVKELVEEVDK